MNKIVIFSFFFLFFYFLPLLLPQVKCKVYPKDRFCLRFQCHYRVEISNQLIGINDPETFYNLNQERGRLRKVLPRAERQRTFVFSPRSRMRLHKSTPAPPLPPRTQLQKKVNVN